MIDPSKQPRTSKRIRKRVYIVGCYRSGTTLLERILRCHPEVVGLGFETLLFTHIVPRRTLPKFNQGMWEQVLHHHFGVPSWRQFQGDPLQAFDAIAERLALERGASVFVEKTPFHLFHVERILTRSPEAKILHVVRDGRDVVTSVLGGEYPLGRWRNRGVRLLAMSALWEWFVFEGNRLAGKNNKRFHTVHYEDLVLSPCETLERVARFLGFDHTDEGLEVWLARTQKIKSNSSFETMSGISDQGVGRWLDPEKLQPKEADLLNRLLAPTLSVVGYETNGAQVPQLREWYGQTGKFICALIRTARFRENAGYWPPRHAWSFLRHSFRLPRQSKARADM